jgi:hypothetical protein
MKAFNQFITEKIKLSDNRFDKIGKIDISIVNNLYKTYLSYINKNMSDCADELNNVCNICSDIKGCEWYGVDDTVFYYNVDTGVDFLIEICYLENDNCTMIYFIDDLKISTADLNKNLKQYGFDIKSFTEFKNMVIDVFNCAEYMILKNDKGQYNKYYKFHN